MKVAQIFWKWNGKPVALDSNATIERFVDSRIWMNPAPADRIETNFMLVEHPSLLRSPVVCVDAIVDPGGATRQWRPMLYQFSEEPAPKLIYDPAPRSLEILIETVKDSI